MALPPEPARPTDGDGDGAAAIRVLIVEDHVLVAQSLSVALQRAEGIEVTGMAGTVADAIAAATAEPPDVVLMDFNLPDGTGAAATRDLLEVAPSARVLIVTAFSGPEILAQSIEAGCHGMLSKTGNLHDLEDAVRAAAAGETLFSREMLTGLVERLRNPTPVLGSDLTKREREVLGLLADGLGADRIAETLVVSRHTARNHVQNVLMKLGAHSQLEAVAIARREKLLG